MAIKTNESIQRMHNTYTRAHTQMQMYTKRAAACVRVCVCSLHDSMEVCVMAMGTPVTFPLGAVANASSIQPKKKRKRNAHTQKTRGREKLETRATEIRIHKEDHTYLSSVVYRCHRCTMSGASPIYNGHELHTKERQSTARQYIQFG